MIYKIYALLIATPLFILFTIVIGVLVILSALFGLTRLAHYHIPRIWGRGACALYLLPVEVKGLEYLDKQQSYIFLANHQGYFDILLMYGYLSHSFKWMMKDYLKKMPVVGIACICSRQIFVGDSLASIQKAVNDARKTLRGGMSMTIFPEGTRTSDGRMQPFKRGAFMLANEIGLPIVPITIKGSYEAFSRKAWMVTRAPLSLIIHQPITNNQREGKTTKALMADVYDIIERPLMKSDANGTVKA